MKADKCPTKCKHWTFHYCAAAGTHCDKHCCCDYYMCAEDKPKTKKESK